MKVRMVWAGDGEIDSIPEALAILLHAMTERNVRMMKRNPSRYPLLYQSGIRYHRENYHSIHPEDWRDAAELVRTGTGDCEDLACYRSAELRVKFGDPLAHCMFIATERPEGRLFHIIVQHGSGLLEDPSRALGMGSY